MKNDHAAIDMGMQADGIDDCEGVEKHKVIVDEYTDTHGAIGGTHSAIGEAGMCMGGVSF